VVTQVPLHEIRLSQRELHQMNVPDVKVESQNASIRHDEGSASLVKSIGASITKQLAFITSSAGCSNGKRSRPGVPLHLHQLDTWFILSRVYGSVSNQTVCCLF